MKPDLNQSEKTCFDNAINSPISMEQSQTALILEQLKQEFYKHPVDLKKKIKIEIDSNSSQPESKTIKISIQDDVKNSKEKKLIFGWIGTKELLTLIILDIDKEFQIFVDRYLIHVFINMLISKDLSQHHEQMHMKCLSTEFKCIMENLSLHCKSFTPTTIEKSNAFISSCGTLINANYLYNTSTDHVHNKKFIESIFRKYC